MKKMWLVFGGIFCIITIICYGIFYNYLPTRTPLKIARVQSGLNISKNVKILDFEENYSSTGEGYIFIVVKLTEAQLETVLQDCREKSYKTLTTGNLIKDGFLDNNPKFGITLPKRDIRAINDGYYRLDNTDLNDLDFSITVLDVLKRELIIYVSFP